MITRGKHLAVEALERSRRALHVTEVHEGHRRPALVVVKPQSAVARIAPEELTQLCLRRVRAEVGDEQRSYRRTSARSGARARAWGTTA